jgi:ubiquinone/menaquinone biosynthesis C-methylase UbiE
MGLSARGTGMNTKNFIESHYARHANHFESDLVDEDRIKISKSWFDESTADYWRHARAYECAALLSHRRESTWLTIGDGRWGLDSLRIRKKGFSAVLPTDISEALLRAAKQRGLIDGYAVENAEKLNFGDNTFDYVFCKESLHHFPRPYAALYEMLRVARNAVFIIEPNDTYEIVQSGMEYAPISAGRLRGVVKRLRAMARIAKDYARTGAIRQTIKFNNPDWETSGNYFYAISRRELKKVALGLNMPQLIFKGLNDHYIKGCEFEPADENRSAMFRDLLSTIRSKDDLCREGWTDHNVIMAGLFRKSMDETTRQRFVSAGWEVIDLPANPYIPREP